MPPKMVEIKPNPGLVGLDSSSTLPKVVETAKPPASVSRSARRDNARIPSNEPDTPRVDESRGGYDVMTHVPNAPLLS